MDIYAPLAHRLGIWQMKGELEDLAFAQLDPDNYALRRRQGAPGSEERESYIQDVIEILQRELEPLGDHAEISGPPQARLQHLRQDGSAGQGLRPDLRPDRVPGPGRLASRTATARWASCIRSGSRCRAGSRTTSPCPRATATSRCTPPWCRTPASRWRCRSAPTRCTDRRVRRRRPLALQGGRASRRRVRRALRLAAPAHGLAEGGARRRGVRRHASRSTSSRTRSSSSRPRATCARCRRAARRSTSPTGSTPTSATTASAPRSTAGWCRWTTASRTATSSRS